MQDPTLEPLEPEPEPSEPVKHIHLRRAPVFHMNPRVDADAPKLTPAPRPEEAISTRGRRHRKAVISRASAQKNRPHKARRGHGRKKP